MKEEENREYKVGDLLEVKETGKGIVLQIWDNPHTSWRRMKVYAFEVNRELNFSCPKTIAMREFYRKRLTLLE